MGCLTYLSTKFIPARLRRQTRRPLEISAPTNCRKEDWSLPGLSDEQLFLIKEKALADATLMFPRRDSKLDGRGRQRSILVASGVVVL
ncbi:MAG: hypothetical protein M1817_005331 [Caeruleum heppii]|nr:MAG: hypothetical protein M1817_005331 [Caeruleum heppii]